jgi:hypothetical protein
MTKQSSWSFRFNHTDYIGKGLSFLSITLDTGMKQGLTILISDLVITFGLVVP